MQLFSEFCPHPLLSPQMKDPVRAYLPRILSTLRGFLVQVAYGNLVDPPNAIQALGKMLHPPYTKDNGA
jgi:hypothetical protein